MKQVIISFLVLIGCQTLFAQEEKPKFRFYLGASYGTSYSIGDFRDTDINNPDAGFAKNGYKIDFFGGFPITEEMIFTTGFRYQNFIRSSETGIGLGGEIGIGLQTNLGKHISLLPTFTFSGGIVTISDVKTTTDNVIAISDYRPRIRSFNLGLSLGYRFFD